jgi:hypothetical protein
MTNLVTIRPGVTLDQPAAASFLRVEAVAGHVDVNSSYRDWDLQYKLWEAWRNGSGVLALHPDRSMHCKGLAIDTDDVSLMRSMGDYGWRGTVPDEDWHFDYFPQLDKFYGQVAVEDSRPFDPSKEDDDMAVLITVSHPLSDTDQGQVYWSVDLQGRTKARIQNGTELDWRRNLGIPEYVNQSPAVLEGYSEIV